MVDGIGVEDRVLRHEDVAHRPVVAERAAHAHRVPAVLDLHALDRAREAEDDDPRAPVGVVDAGHRREVRADRGLGPEDLVAGDAVAALDRRRHGVRGHEDRVAALGGHRCVDDLAGRGLAQELPEPLVLVEPPQRADLPEGRDVHRDRQRRRSAAHRQTLLGEEHLPEVGAPAAELLRDRQAQVARGTHVGVVLERERRLAVVLGRSRGERVGQAAGELDEVLLTGVEPLSHRSVTFAWW